MPERARAQVVIDRLNAEHAGQPLFSLTRWEDSYFTATGSFQEQILQPGEHDIVVFIFWKRLGTDLPPAFNRVDGTSRTGTEYEFEDARDARERRADHLPDVLVYRKTARVLFNEETVDIERAQKRALDRFWERWFRSDAGHSIAAFQNVADAGDLEHRLERDLRDWLRNHQAGTVVWDIQLLGSPYRGLAAYEEEHAGLFFGRDGDVNRARAAFIEAAIGKETGRRGTPFLLILGASGSGKSSFLRAGLVPRMRAAGAPAFLEDGSDRITAFRSLVLTPRELGEGLCRGLARALYSSSQGLAELADGGCPTPEAFGALAAGSPDSASDAILSALDRVAANPTDDTVPARIGLLLAIDQAEELFARSEPDRRAFLVLLTVLAATGRVWVTGTMRNDFYDRLRLDPELSALSDRGALYDLAPPALADYRDIIRRPAQAAGLRFEVSEHRDLAADIESEARGDGALPMVAFLLDQLFQERRGDLLTIETYDRLGGAAGALAQRGEQVFSGLPNLVQDAFPRVVRRLVRKSLKDLTATATSAPLSAFPIDSAERQLIEALRQARLVQSFTVHESEASGGSPWVRWSHEALLIRWPRLRQSVDADRRDYETLNRLQGNYSLWRVTPAAQQHERLPADLALAEAADLVARWGTDVDEPLRQFVREAVAQEQSSTRRNRRITTATVGALLLLSVTAMFAGALAVKQKNLALKEQSSADRTVRFMVSLFKLDDPGEIRGNAVTVREMLDRGAAAVQKSLASEPGIRADILTSMGQAYSGLGLYDPATKLLAAARTDQKAADNSAESRVRTLVASGTNLYLAGSYPQAEGLLRDAVDLARRKLAATDILRSEALDSLADVLGQLEKYPEAKQLCNEALAVDRKRGADGAPVLARTLDSLGSLYYFSGDLPKAESAMREALALHEKSSGLRDASTAEAMNNLATVLFQSGRYGEAMAVYQQALPVHYAVYGTEHPQVAALLSSIGRTALMKGDIGAAEPTLRQALAMNEKLLGLTHDSLVPSLNSLAMIDGYTGQTQRARQEIERAEQIARLPNHGELLDQVLLNVADLALAEGDTVRAAAALAESRRLLERAYPLADHPSEAWRFALWDSVDAELLARRGDEATAHRMIDAALPIVTKRFGPTGFHTLLVRRRSTLIE
jgi:tetratricopeptide (TPR) repeat protein